ncbi:hypothetical protein CXB51_028313 [Gossypium anomalum]|uniref:adenylate kinase n=1 Tax=Gossypium anomalum TaxID=47600 RepID=A0A8J6CSP1_9ROSI|nr:hypothetical protein CXB51_028313 [Gossypium anomalum]
MASSSMNLEEIPFESLMNELLRRMKCAPKLEKRLILIGPPGFGKGTQSSIIKDDHCLCHLATGDMLRVAVSAKTPLGIKAKEAMDKGELVSDDLVVGIIDEVIKKPSCLMDHASNTDHILELKHRCRNLKLHCSCFMDRLLRILQVVSLFDCDVKLEDYLLKSYYKTASLIAASTKGATIFSGADRSVTEQMYEYGKNLGLSFQVVDDILDFTQSAKQLGKLAGSDLAKGNLTAQVINMA